MSALFEPRHDARVIRSSFGGGWVIPLSPAGSQVLLEFFNSEPGEIPVAATESTWAQGYIVEPYQVESLAQFMISHDCVWRVEA